jgi:hypothetical protein
VAVRKGASGTVIDLGTNNQITGFSNGGQQVTRRSSAATRFTARRASL